MKCIFASFTMILFSSVFLVGEEKDVVQHTPSKYGVLDAEGRVVSACQWDTAGDFMNGMTLVRKDKKWGFLDRKGKLLTPCVWDDAKWFYHKDRAAVKKDGKWGYIDSSGNIEIKLEWDWCGNFQGDLAVVALNDLEGFIDVDGKVIQKPQWESIRLEGAYVLGKTDGKSLLMNTKGKILHPMMWDEVTVYSDELVAAEKDGRTTFLDAKGEVIVDGVMRIGRKSEIIPILKEEGWGYVCQEGELLSMPQWDEGLIFSGDYAVVTKNKINYILYKSGKQVAVPQYDIQDLSEGLWWVEDKKTNKVGYLNESLELVIPCEWENDHHSLLASNGRIIVKRDGLYGAIDLSGKVIIPVIWDSLDSFYEGDHSIVRKNGKYGYIDRNGKLITKVEFDKCFDFYEDHAALVKGKTSIFIGKSGKVVNTVDGVVDYVEDYYKMLKNGKVGAVDLKGNLIISPVWDDIEWIGSDSTFIVTKKNLMGLITVKDKLVTTPQWEAISRLGDSLHFVKKDGKWGIIDGKGQLIVEPRWIDFNSQENYISSGDIPLVVNVGYIVTDAKGKKGYVSPEGKLTIPTVNDELYFLGDIGYSEKDSLTGFINKSGKVISECLWSSFYELDEGMFVVQMPVKEWEDE